MDLQNLREIISSGEIDLHENYMDTSDTLFDIAIKNYDIDLLNLLITKGADINLENFYGDCPLVTIHRKISNQSQTKDNLDILLMMIQLLIDNGADLDLLSHNNQSPLFSLAKGFRSRREVPRIYAYIELLLMNNVTIPSMGNDILTLLQNFLSAYEHDGKIFGLIINELDDINMIVNSKGRTLLMELSRSPEAIEHLLKHPKIDPELKDFSGATALMLAANNKHFIESMQAILDKGVNVDAIDNSGNTALHYADGALIISKLIQAGADVNIQNHDGCTPLHKCGMDTDSINAFSQGNPDPTLTNNTYGCPPLHDLYRNANILFSKSRRNFADDLITCTDAYLNLGLNVNFLDDNGYNLLHHLCYTNLRSENRVKIAQHIINKGINIDEILPNSKTCLDIVSSQNDPLFIKLLNGEASDEPQKHDNHEIDRAFFNACKNGQRGVAEVLLKNNEIDFMYTDDDGNTALHYAAAKGYSNMCGILMDGGSNIDYTNRAGQTPLHLSVENRFKVIAKELISRGCDCNIIDKEGYIALHHAALNGQNDIIEQLVDNGSDIDFPDRNGNTPLLMATSKRKIQTIKYLIENGADIEVCNNDNSTPLILAATLSNKVLCSLLLDNGAQPDHGDSMGNTPLHYASNRGAREIIKVLISDGADINITNKQGDTPLHGACYNGQLQSVKILLNHGADASLTNNTSKTALDIASSEGFKEIVDYLTLIN